MSFHPSVNQIFIHYNDQLAKQKGKIQERKEEMEKGRNKVKKEEGKKI